jgi:hypothetical protein
VNRLPEELRANVPPIRIVRAATPVLLCSGLARLQLVVSTGAVATLDDDQLRAALAHEATHARYRDPLISWGLMAVRTAFFFSPATQLVARSAVNDVERRADDRSVALADDRLGMAGALVRLYAVSSPGSGRRSDAGGPAGRRLARWLHLGRTAAIERRCWRLLSPVAPHRDPYWPVQMTLTAISLAVLLFFVV